MKTDLNNSEIIAQLSRIASHEVAVQTRYSILKMAAGHAGLKKLVERYNHEATESTEHMQKVIDRIYFLDGQVSIKPEPKFIDITFMGPADVMDSLALDLEAEAFAAENYRLLIGMCEKSGDYGTRALAQEILVAEEGAVDELKTLLDMRKAMGDQQFALYLAD